MTTKSKTKTKKRLFQRSQRDLADSRRIIREKLEECLLDGEQHFRWSCRYDDRYDNPMQKRLRNRLDRLWDAYMDLNSFRLPEDITKT
jgi:hypothetical protein